MAVVGIIGPVLFHQWSHCNDCMHCCLSFMQHWQRLAPNGPDLPVARSHLAAVCLPSELDIHRTLLILGGHPNQDCWLCDVHTAKWMRVGFVCEKVVIRAVNYKIHYRIG